MDGWIDERMDVHTNLKFHNIDDEHSMGKSKNQFCLFGTLMSEFCKNNIIDDLCNHDHWAQENE